MMNTFARESGLSDGQMKVPTFAVAPLAVDIDGITLGQLATRADGEAIVGDL